MSSDIRSALTIAAAAAEAIRDAGQLPAGQLYAVLMDRVSLPAFEGMVRLLVRVGLIAKRGDLLCWTGPAA